MMQAIALPWLYPLKSSRIEYWFQWRIYVNIVVLMAFILNLFPVPLDEIQIPVYLNKESIELTY